MEYPKYNEDERLYIKHTFRVNFSDIKISYDDLIKLFPFYKEAFANLVENLKRNI